jgi:pyruvate formate lyase activating enzyme
MAETVKGLVFNIQRFSLHDGPGIRTTLFLKGCPLRCLWCSNPESQDFSPSLIVRDVNCRGCGACVEACPRGAIVLDDRRRRDIQWHECDQCLRCVEACIYNSLKVCGTYMTVGEVMDEVMRDEPFYKNSGGGITISGGEPLAQARFLVELLSASKRAGLHTALDTTGHAQWETLEEILPMVDLALWDVKHLDPEEHKRATGAGNDLILRNLFKASGTTRLWLRVPLVSGFNDSEAHISEVVSLAKEIGAEKISLLPYHEGGRAKCEQLGRRYPFPEGRPPGEGRVLLLKEIIEREGLEVSIGS